MAEFEPYNEEWEREMMRLPKPMLIKLYKEACLRNNDNVPVDKPVGVPKPNPQFSNARKEREELLALIDSLDDFTIEQKIKMACTHKNARKSKILYAENAIKYFIESIRNP